MKLFIYSPYKFNYPEQRRIYDRLRRLVGPGAAAFYKDACFLMGMETPLESTTHLVGHLVREIESSLRAVLSPILEQLPKKEKNHKKEILAALKTLEIHEESDVAKIWLKIPGEGNEYNLPKRAHREDLSSPRSLNKDFGNFWRDINVLLERVLDKFETRALLIQEKLDELLKRETPDDKDITFLRLNIPNSLFALGYFFNRLESPKWLEALEGAGFFNNPPGLEIDSEGKTYRVPEWAQSRYLIKVASHEPEIVLKIAKRIFDLDVENIWIYEDLSEAALKMSPKFASQWVEPAIKWLNQKFTLSYRLSNTLGKLIAYLAQGNEIDVSIRLTREILTVFPALDSYSYEKARIRFDGYDYKKFISENLVELAEKCPDEVLSIFCEILDRCIGFSYSNRDGQFREDLSSYWFCNPDRYSDEISGVSAKKILDLSNQIIERDPSQIRSLIQKFKAYPWRIFDRLSLYLLRIFSTQVSDLIVNRLMDRDRLEWLGLYLDDTFYYSHEHALLLKEQFKNLPIEIQEQIFNWLLAEPSDLSSEIENREKYIKYWRRDWLSIIDEYLPPNLKEIYGELVQELGPVYSLKSVCMNAEVAIWSSSSNPNSPKSGSELSEMAEGDMNNLFAFLQQWQPSERLSSASRNDLAGELCEHVIVPNPHKFVEQIEQFKLLAPEFMVWFLRGLKKALSNAASAKSIFSWEPVVAFCLWMLENLRGIQKHSASDGHFEWSLTCDAIVELIDAGLVTKKSSRIPLTLRQQIWQILELLTRDFRITPGFTPAYQGSNMGPYGVSINSVRGKAMHAVVKYAFWVRLDENGKAQASQNFSDMVEVQQVLEWHLNPQQDPSFAIRTVYGRWLPTLFHLASDWTLQHIDQIFPEESNLHGLFGAAWEGYLYSKLSNI